MEKLIIWLNLLFKSYNISFLGHFFNHRTSICMECREYYQSSEKQNIPTVALGDKNTTVENTISWVVTSFNRPPPWTRYITVWRQLIALHFFAGHLWQIDGKKPWIRVCDHVFSRRSWGGCWAIQWLCEFTLVLPEHCTFFVKIFCCHGPFS